MEKHYDFDLNKLQSVCSDWIKNNKTTQVARHIRLAISVFISFMFVCAAGFFVYYTIGTKVLAFLLLSVFFVFSAVAVPVSINDFIEKFFIISFCKHTDFSLIGLDVLEEECEFFEGFGLTEREDQFIYVYPQFVTVSKHGIKRRCTVQMIERIPKKSVTGFREENGVLYIENSLRDVFVVVNAFEKVDFKDFLSNL